MRNSEKFEERQGLAFILSRLVCLFLVGFNSIVSSWNTRGEEATAAASKLPILTTIGQIRALTGDEARRRYPVRLSGIVTYYDPDWNLLFTEDATGSIFVNAAGQSLELNFGQEVELQGLTDQGRFMPLVSRVRLQKQNTSHAPAYKRVSFAQMLTGKEDSQSVECIGWVKSTSEQGGHATLMVEVDGHEVKVIVPGMTQIEAGNLLNAKVRVRGVCAVLSNEEMQVTGIQIFVPSLNEIHIEENGKPNAFAVRLHAIHELIQTQSVTTNGAVRIQGVVAKKPSGNELWINDRTGSIRIQTLQTNRLNDNMFLELVGNLAWERDLPILTNATYRRLGIGFPTPPEEMRLLFRPSLKGIQQKVLNRSALVRALSSESAEQGHPVVLRGTVTYYDPIKNDCFVQDETGGIWIDTQSGEGNELDLEAGELVEVEGYSAAGFAPSLVKPHFQHLGRGVFPESDAVALSHLMTGKEDSQWVKVAGTVRSADVVDEKLVLDLEMANGGRLKAFVAGMKDHPTSKEWIGARVQVQGVCSSLFNFKRQLLGVQLLVSSTNQVGFLGTSDTDPFSLPIQPISRLMQYRSQGQDEHRVHIRGVVTLQRAENSLFIHDSSDGVQIQTQGHVDVKVGDNVEMVGFPAVGEFTPILQNAIGKRVGTGPLPGAHPVTVGELETGQFDSDLVRLDATFLEASTHLQDRILTLSAADRIFTAVMPNIQAKSRLTRTRQGTLVRLTGICSVQVDENQSPKSFRLLLRGPEDVEILNTPMSWFLPYAYRIVASLTVVSLVTLVWVLLLRSKVRVQADIVRQKLVKEAALEERYRELFENASDLVFSIDFAGQWLSLNNATERILGYTKDELRKITAFDLILPECHEQVRQIMQRLRSGEPGQTSEIEIANRSRERMTIEVSFKLLHHEGEALGLDGIARNTTERKLAETALRESEERFRSLVDNSPEGIFIQIQGRIAYLNNAALRLWGACSPEQLLGSEVLDRCHLDCRTAVTDRIKHLNEDRQAAAWMEQTHLRLDQTAISVEVSATPIIFKDKPGALVFFRDIGERKHLEEQFRQAQKMEAIGQLAGGVAHDFNNILAATFMRLDLAAQDPEITPAMEEALRELREDASRAADLTKQLLMFSRRHAINVKCINLNEVVDRLLKMLRRVLGEHIQLEFHSATETAWIEADAGMMEQVLMNLVVNARDAMPQSGRLTISTQTVDVSEAWMKHNPEARVGRFTCLSVADTGCGMDAAALERIFEPFFTTKAVGKGTGLGLSTVYGIVKQHRGWIEVTSEVGKGSTFKVHLPSGRPTAPDDSSGEQTAPAGGSETILLVEDDEALRDTTGKILRRAGYKVLVASNGVEALAIAESQTSPIDLVLTDMVMPGGINGLDLCQRLLAEMKNVKVLLTSGYSVELSNPTLIPGNKVDFLPKPCNPKTLLRTIRHCLDNPLLISA